MPVSIPPHSRYAQASCKQLPDGTVIIDPYSRRRLDTADFPNNLLHVTVQPGDTVFSLANRLYGSARFYWIVCECIHQSNPFLPLLPFSLLILIHPQALQEEGLQGG